MTKKVAAKKVIKKALKKLKPHEQVVESLVELIRITSTVVPDDVARTLLAARKNEAAGTSASYAMDIIRLMDMLTLKTLFIFVVAFNSEESLEDPLIVILLLTMLRENPAGSGWP